MGYWKEKEAYERRKAVADFIDYLPQLKNRYELSEILDCPVKYQEEIYEFLKEELRKKEAKTEIIKSKKPIYFEIKLGSFWTTGGSYYVIIELERIRTKLRLFFIAYTKGLSALEPTDVRNLKKFFTKLVSQINKIWSSEEYDVTCPKCKKEFILELEEGEDITKGVKVECPNCNKNISIKK